MNYSIVLVPVLSVVLVCLGCNILIAKLKQYQVSMQWSQYIFIGSIIGAVVSILGVLGLLNIPYDYSNVAFVIFVITTTSSFTYKHYLLENK